MSREEIVAAIEDARQRDRRGELLARLRATDPAVVFEALFPIATAPQLAGPAYDAACLLLVLRPPCAHPCYETLRMLLKGWDVSIEELPCYLAAHFGQDAMLRAVSELEAVPLTDDERARLDVVRYWLDLYVRGELRSAGRPWSSMRVVVVPTAPGDEATPTG